MNEDIYLKAPDGHEFSAYISRPTGPIFGGIVVAMEMYGVNSYLRGVCDRFSSQVAAKVYTMQSVLVGL